MLVSLKNHCWHWLAWRSCSGIGCAWKGRWVWAMTCLTVGTQRMALRQMPRLAALQLMNCLDEHPEDNLNMLLSCLAFSAML